jgi:hypothetical protein
MASIWRIKATDVTERLPPTSLQKLLMSPHQIIIKQIRPKWKITVAQQMRRKLLLVRYTQERRSGETVGRPHQVKALEKKKKYWKTHYHHDIITRPKRTLSLSLHRCKPFIVCCINYTPVHCVCVTFFRLIFIGRFFADQQVAFRFDKGNCWKFPI